MRENGKQFKKEDPRKGEGARASETQAHKSWPNRGVIRGTKQLGRGQLMGGGD